MSDTFQKGDEVVCVGSPPNAPGKGKVGTNSNVPLKGHHYFVREARPAYGEEEIGQALLLVEVVNPPVNTSHGFMEVAFYGYAFKKVKPETIAIFRQMAIDAPKLATKKAKT